LCDAFVSIAPFLYEKAQFLHLDSKLANPLCHFDVVLAFCLRYDTKKYLARRMRSTTAVKNVTFLHPRPPLTTAMAAEQQPLSAPIDGCLLGISLSAHADNAIVKVSLLCFLSAGLRAVQAPDIQICTYLTLDLSPSTCCQSTSGSTVSPFRAILYYVQSFIPCHP